MYYITQMGSLVPFTIGFLFLLILLSFSINSIPFREPIYFAPEIFAANEIGTASSARVFSFFLFLPSFS